MQLIHTHPSKQSKLNLDRNHVIVDIEQYHKAKDMEKAMILFIKRRDNGEIKSTKTYNSFKAILGL